MRSPKREPSQERFLRTQTSEQETTMAITLGTFSKQDNGTFTGTLRTLNVSAAISIVPVDKHSDNAPDYRVYAGQRYEVGAGWSQVAKSSGETKSAPPRPAPRRPLGASLTRSGSSRCAPSVFTTDGENNDHALRPHPGTGAELR